MAGPVQPHPPGSGIFLQGFSRGSCLHSLLFPVSLSGPQPGDNGSLEKGLEGLHSSMVVCAGAAYTWGPGEGKLEGIGMPGPGIWIYPKG